MNQHPEYEKIIAARLQEVPVPPLADEIWARIAARLDVDMPEDDGDGDDPGGNSDLPGGSGAISWGLSILLVGLITIFFLLRQGFKSPGTQPATVPLQTTISPAPEEAPPPNINEPREGTATPVTRGLRDNNGTETTELPVMVPEDNTTIVQPQLPATVAAPTVSPIDTISASPNEKKPRGVRGLTIDDYKIVPKKDSSN